MLINILRFSLIGFSLFTSSTAFSQTQNRKAHLASGAMTLAPFGLYDFCSRLPVECFLDANSPPKKQIRPAAFTKQQLKFIAKINSKINSANIGVPDTFSTGQEELWDMPLTHPRSARGRGRPYGDCEDFALEKRRALLNAGVPAHSLFLATVVSEASGLHAVLVVSTDQGDLVLDNLSAQIKLFHKTEYLWLKRQVTTTMVDWAEIP